jgi:lysine 6-dehydrogenase
MKGYRYAILGSGRQGTATAYDLGLLGDAALIIMADLEEAAAMEAADRVNRLLGREVAHAARLDARDEKAVIELLRDARVEVFVSGVPYFHNLGLTRCAIRAGASMCDFGGNTDLVRQQLALDTDARNAGITIIPDCGQVPGLGSSLCAYAMDLLDDPRDVLMYDGGIPRNPQPPWNYILTFSIEGLTNEYYGTALFIREGELIEVPCFEEYELVQFPEPIGQLEAFTTAGGTSNMPWTFEGKLRTLQNKTLRWPGHYAQWKAFSEAGLLDLTPFEVDGKEVIPRHVLHSLIEPRIRARAGEPDMVIVRVIARGLKDGKETEKVLDFVDYYDEETGFTAMERSTGWHAAIMAGLIARGETAKGALPVEVAVPSSRFVEEIRKRGFDLQIR